MRITERKESPIIGLTGMGGGVASYIFMGGGAEPYEISRSIRFSNDDSDASHLVRTPASNGNKKTFTIACWTKRSQDGENNIFVGSSNWWRYHSSNELIYYWSGSDAIQTAAKFRDQVAWAHTVLRVDTTQATASDRVRIYVNGVLQVVSGTQPSQNADLGFNGTYAHYLGSQGTGQSNGFNGYIADFHMVDGQSLDADNFGEFDDNNVWQPKKYDGTHGTNGFHLKFDDVTNHQSIGHDSTVEGTRYSSMMHGNTQNTFKNMFDGSTSTYTLGPNGGKTMAFIPDTGIAWTDASGGVEIYFHTVGSQPDKVKINNGSWVNQTATGWQKVSTGDGTLTYLEFSDQSNAEAVVYAIRINGTILTDPSGANDWVVNNVPVAAFDVVGNTSIQASGTVVNKNTGTYYDFVNVDMNGVNSNQNGVELIRVNIQALGLPTPATITFDSYEQGGGGWATVANTVFTDQGNTTVSSTSSSNTRYNTCTIPAGATRFGIPGSYNSGLSLYSNGINNMVWNGRPIKNVYPTDIDSVIDVPTNKDADSGNNLGNYCVMHKNHGNLTVTNCGTYITGSGSWGQQFGTMGMTEGKYYWEWTSMKGVEQIIGVGPRDTQISGNLGAGPTGRNGSGYGAEAGTLYGTGNQSWSATSWAVGDVIGVMFDATAGELRFAKNGTILNSGNPASTGLTSGPYLPIVSLNGNSMQGEINFGQMPFKYSVPSGYKTLCSQNLPTPTIDKGSDYFDISLYTGNGGGQTVSGLGFSPDLVWMKSRTNADNHSIFDTVRGPQKGMHTNLTSAEFDDASTLNGFTTDGYTLAGHAVTNANNANYVGWAWDTDSSTVTNSDGTITSYVRANTTAGFSIISYTGTGSNGTIGHGLGKAPGFVILKGRNFVDNWRVHHKDLHATNAYQYYLMLESTNAISGQSNNFMTGNPDSSTIKLSTDSAINGSGRTMIAYAFAEIEGYSSIGTYTGNANANGPFVYTGFRPRWVMHKRYDTGGANVGDWRIWDTARDIDNDAQELLFPGGNGAGATNAAHGLDILSNGFKFRTADSNINANGGSYVYMAFAEHPFATSRAR